MLKPLKILLLGLLSIAIGSSSAQNLSCPDIVNQALEAAEGFCSELGRNQACYGNFQLNAQAQPDVSVFSFSNSGDIVDAGDILSLDLSALDVNAGNWGVALMSLQVDIPNTLPGQNITFVLFGDVQLENAASEGQSPMQAFYLQTGIGAMDCEEAPQSGLLVQTPEGVDEVSFNINGVDVTIGSTILFQTVPISDEEFEMIVSTVEGTAIVSFDDEVYPAIEGTRFRLPLNNELLPLGRPSLPEAYEEGSLDNLPTELLLREIRIALPLVNLELLHQHVNEGLPPCGVEGLPACEDLPSLVRDRTSTRWGQRFEEGQNCIPRPTETVDATGLPPVLGATRPFPFCPAIDRASRPDGRENTILALDADEDGDSVPNVDDACPFVAGTRELQGCPETPLDRDGDGLSDGLDLCPYEAGSNRGCPEPPRDIDGDGIIDALDECPLVAGIAALRGCPAPDRDGDGFADERDACPDVAGTDNGCPVPGDADGDGIVDSNDQCPTIAGLAEFSGCPAPDADADGVPDSQDRCPDEAGTADMEGCPLPFDNADADGDGIPDSQDQCPSVAGIAEYIGCPPPSRGSDTAPDTDGDGIVDNEDECPDISGIADYRGCPPPDRDGDGVLDSEDKCPDQAGKAEDGGCPLPDLDQDGVPDVNDECPRQAGDPNNYGCPLPDRDQDGVPDAEDGCPSEAGDPNNKGCPLR